MPLDVVAVVRHNRTLSMGNYRKAADEGGFFLRGFNYLLLFRKRPERGSTAVAEQAAAAAADGSRRRRPVQASG